MPKSFDIDEDLLLLGGLIAVVFVWSKGGLQQAAQSLVTAAGQAAANAANAVTTGAVNAIGQSVGLPTTDQLTDDPYVTRYIMDDPSASWADASKYSTSSAWLNAQTIPYGQGVAPPANSALAKLFPPYILPDADAISGPDTTIYGTPGT